jgi:hypothetical protein
MPETRLVLWRVLKVRGMSYFMFGIVVIVAGDALQAETMESGRSGEVAAGLNALTALDNAMRETG